VLGAFNCLLRLLQQRDGGAGHAAQALRAHGFAVHRFVRMAWNQADHLRRDELTQYVLLDAVRSLATLC